MKKQAFTALCDRTDGALGKKTRRFSKVTSQKIHGGTVYDLPPERLFEKKGNSEREHQKAVAKNKTDDT